MYSKPLLCYALLALNVSVSSSFMALKPTRSLLLAKISSGLTFRTNLVMNFGTMNEHDESFPSRRKFMASSILPLALLGNTLPARASLVQFPCKSGLMNTYHFMRAGESLLEEQGILSTNPLFLTNRENALSDTGRVQVQEACRLMELHNINPSVLKFSLAANAMDTADMISNELQVGRNRLVPEYTYLDQRGVGRWDGLPLQSTQEAVWAMDVQEAGKEGLGGRPPAHEDGTPNETLGNQVTRLRQLISLLETSLSGDEIMLVFPDGTGPAVLSCLIAGIPLDRAHEMEFRPGELRLDITYKNVRAAMPATPSLDYANAIERGRVQLANLRAQDPQEITNVRDQQYEAEALALQQKEARLQEIKKLAEQEKQLALQKRRDEVEASRRERKRQEEADRQQKQQEANVARQSRQPTSNDRPVGAVALGALGLVSLGAIGLQPRDEKQDYGVATSGNERVKEAPKKVEQVDSTDEVKEVVINDETLSLESLDMGVEGTVAVKDDIATPTTAQQQDQESSTQDLLAATPPEFLALEELMENSPIEIPEFQTRQEERAQAAERAMQEYLDQDDGGEAWLGAMSELMSEED